MEQFKIVPVQSVPGDCLYAAIIKGARLTCSVGDLRTSVCHVLRENHDLYDDTISELLDFGVISNRITQDELIYRTLFKHEWGTSTTIHILASILRLSISVVTFINGKLFVETFPSEFKQTLFSNRENGKIATLYLYYTNNSHFELLEQK